MNNRTVITSLNILLLLLIWQIISPKWMKWLEKKTGPFKTISETFGDLTHSAGTFHPTLQWVLPGCIHTQAVVDECSIYVSILWYPCRLQPFHNLPYLMSTTANVCHQWSNSSCCNVSPLLGWRVSWLSDRKPDCFSEIVVILIVPEACFVRKQFLSFYNFIKAVQLTE